MFSRSLQGFQQFGTVDASEIRRSPVDMVVYPIIYKVLNIPGVRNSRRISGKTINSITIGLLISTISPWDFSRLNIDPRLDILAGYRCQCAMRWRVAKGRAFFGSIRSAYLGMIFVEYMI